MRQKSIIVATPDDGMRHRLATLIDGEPDFQVIVRAGDLMTTYTSVEERLPDAVLIADVLANLPEFEVMRGLFETLDIRWLVVTTPNRPVIAAELTRERSDLFAVPADAAPSLIVRQLKSLTRSVVSRAPPTPQPTLPAAQTIKAQPRAARPAPGHRPTPPPSGGGMPTMGASLRSPPRAQNVKPSNPAAEDSGAPPARTPAKSAPPARGGRPPPIITPRGQDEGTPVDPESRVILIGSSTGGVDALLSILSHFPVRCPPTMIVQHTGLGFGASLAGLLDRQCRASVRLAERRMMLRPGEVIIGAGMKSHLVLEDAEDMRVALRDGPPVSGHTPSVDVLFRSAVPLGKRISAAILTGMGRDGADGLLELRKAGARTIAQDEESSVVWGMPRAAAEIGAAQAVLPLDRIGPALLSRDPLGATRRREAQT